jgi:hypothetical protein
MFHRSSRIVSDELPMTSWSIHDEAPAHLEVRRGHHPPYIVDPFVVYEQDAAYI